MTRPLKLTPEVQTEICDLLREGHFLTTICAAVGIHRDTVNQWLLRSKTEGEPFTTFAREFRKAKAEGEIMHARKLIASPDWKASQFFLQQRWAGHWRQQTAEVKVSGTIDVKQDLADVLAKIAAKQNPDSPDGDGED